MVVKVNALTPLFFFPSLTDVQCVWHKLQRKVDCCKNGNIPLPDSETGFMFMHHLLTIRGEVPLGLKGWFWRCKYLFLLES